MTEWWILRGHEPVQSTVEEWSEWVKQGFDATKRVAQDTVGDVRVSTVFLGLDHSWNGPPPVLFETMCFGGKWDEYMWRYHTWDEAIAGHQAIMESILMDADPESIEVGV